MKDKPRLTLNFLETEKFIDLGNEQEYLNMDKLHLSRTKQKEFVTSVKGWKKNNIKAIETLEEINKC